jgi:hypothetical protein
MKYAVAVVVVALIAALPVHAWLASNDGFNEAVSSIEQQYHAQPENIPLSWFAGLCAAISTGGGVRHMRIAEFNQIHGVNSPEALAALLGGHLSPAWHRMVFSRDNAEDFSLIYARPEGHAIRMLVASYDHGELDLIRMDLNGQRLAHFVQNPGHASGQHNAIPD